MKVWGGEESRKGGEAVGRWAGEPKGWGSVLPRQDSNPDKWHQKPLCCQLHHGGSHPNEPDMWSVR